MTVRTSRKSVTFTRPFSLSGIETAQPAGTYEVETEEELLEGVSFPAYRRIATAIFLPAQPGSMILAEIATIDPLELDAAQEQDAMAAHGTGPTFQSSPGMSALEQMLMQGDTP